MTRALIIGLCGLQLAAACQDSDETGSQARELPEVTHARAHLRWKRFRAAQNDFARALELPEREVCVEASGDQCAAGGVVMLTDWLRAQNIPEAEIEAECRKLQGDAPACVDAPYIPFDNPRGVHLTHLGGNSPFLAGIADSLDEPNVITPLALDRFAITACGERAARDREGAPKVFKQLDLTKSVSANSKGVGETVTDMYKRFLARLPTDEEKAAALSLLEGAPLTGEAFARSVCFLVATLPESTFQ